MNNKSTSLQGHLYVFLATFLISGSVIACKLLANSMNPLGLTLLRFIIATVVFAPIVLFDKTKRYQIKKALPRSFIISFFYSMYFVAMFAALAETNVLHVGTLGTLAPLVTALFAIPLFGTRIGWMKLIVYIIAIVGTSIIVFNGSLHSLLQFSLNHGDMIYLIGVLLISLYYIALRGLHGGINPSVLAFCTLTCGTLWIAGAMIFLHIPLDISQINTSTEIVSLLYVAIFTTCLTAYLFQKGSTLLSSTRVSAYQYTQPILVAVMAIFIFGDVPSVLGWIGAGISIIATVVLLAMKETK
ncbi:MAG: DMT family transporter [Bacteroidaceae bacterium]